MEHGYSLLRSHVNGEYLLVREVSTRAMWVALININMLIISVSDTLHFDVDPDPYYRNIFQFFF